MVEITGTPATEIRGPCCGVCKFYMRDATKLQQGFCCNVPPLVALAGQGLVGMRPPIKATDLPCKEFKREGL